MAKSRPIDLKGQRSFKVLILNEVDRLSRDAQASLRRTMEKYSSACRLVLVCSNVSKVRGMHHPGFSVLPAVCRQRPVHQQGRSMFRVWGARARSRSGVVRAGGPKHAQGRMRALPPVPQQLRWGCLIAAGASVRAWAQVIEPVRSRCLCIRVAAPTEAATLQLLRHVGDCEKLQLPPEFAQSIVRARPCPQGLPCPALPWGRQLAALAAARQRPDVPKRQPSLQGSPGLSATPGGRSRQRRRCELPSSGAILRACLQDSRRNLRRALLMLETCKAAQLPCFQG